MLPANTPFKPGEAVLPSSQVELSISCRNLENKDWLSKSDPLCVLYIKNSTESQFIEVGRTEVISDNLNPDFVKKFQIKYCFEESQKLLFQIYDVDSSSTNLSHHDFLGSAEMTLAEIVGSGASAFERPIYQDNRKCGKIIVRAEETIACKEVLNVQFKALNLDKKDFFGKSDPYLEFQRVNEDGSFTVVHRTEVIKNTLNPVWNPFSSSIQHLCNGDKDRLINVICFDWNNNGSDLIGDFQVTINELLRGSGSSNTYEVINAEKKAKGKKYTNSGQVHVVSCYLTVKHSFLDYINSGMQMNFTVAIDFTASNGQPSQPDSLHFVNPHGLNWYSAALRAVGEIIQDYDSLVQLWHPVHYI